MQENEFLFEGNIHFNITLGADEISDDALVDTAEYVYAHNFILGRLVALGGHVMMLDEATSSIDSITESLIQKAIGRSFEEKTVIVIAH
jgi:ATP-binding cassette subfamily B multidrug efflux pump